MADRWRLIVDEALDGRLNMAIDRAMQLARAEGSAPPTLRLYAWARPTVSLGRFQDLSAVDMVAAQTDGVDIVRRFTGGRGVLHDDELTYSIVASVEDGVPRGVAASYRHLSRGLVEAYAGLGVETGLVARDRPSNSAAACYLQTTRADLTAGDAKISGSAQVWHETTVLQHGSIVERRDIGRESRLFGLDADQTEHLSRHSKTLEDMCGRRLARSEIEAAVVAGFELALGITFVRGVLSAREAELAAALVSDVSAPRPQARGVRG